jgi:hypothetical protein
MIDEAANNERYIAIRAALFDDVITACEHIGERQGDHEPDTPLLCYRHRPLGIMCWECFVAHVDLDHIAEELPKLRCDACDRRLDKLDGSDITNMVAFTRRSIMWELTVTDTVTAVTANKPHKHVSYTGSTIVAFEHLLCFACHALVMSMAANGN